MGSEKRWVIGCVLLACCSGASDAGQLMVDAGEVISDAGELLSDAGAQLADSGHARAQTMVSCVDEQGTWYAETTVPEDSDLDAWLCEPEGRSPTVCVQADVELDGTKLRALCGFTGSQFHTLRVRLR